MGIVGNVAAPHAGEPIGRYRLVRRLGQGAMGVVWLAHDPALDRHVAIKLQQSQHGDDHRRALREGRALAAVAHPNVLPIFEVGLASERAYLVMEYVGGETLRMHLARREHTVAEIVALFVAAARGLAALHAAGLVHCDFKPDNVMVEPRRGGARVLLCDLGLAAGDTEHPTGPDDVSSITVPGFGTPRYMAPEQHDGEIPTPLADQYAWCVALFEAIHGEPPFFGEPATLVASKRVGPAPPAPSSRHRALDDVLRRGLAPDPGARYSDMHTLVSAVRRATRARRVWPIAVPLVGLAAFGYMLDHRATVAVSAREAPAVTEAVRPSDDPAERFAEAEQAHIDGELEPAIVLGAEAYELALAKHDEYVTATAACATFRWVSDVHGEREANLWRNRAQTALASVANDHPGWHDYDEGVFNIEFGAARAATAWPALTNMLVRAQASPIDGARAWVVGLQFHAELLALGGDLVDADARGDDAIAAAREAFGNDHMQTAAALLAAATWAVRVSDGDRALVYVEEAGRIYARLSPPEHARMIHYYMVEGWTWGALHQYATAFASLARAREQQERWVPKSVGLAAQLDGTLGVLARRMGDIERARQLQYSALVTAEAELGVEHPRVARRLHNLAVLEREAGNCARAREYAKRADTIYAAAVDHSHRVELAELMTCELPASP